MSDARTEARLALRKEMYRADCAAYGHIFDLVEAIAGSERPNPNDPRGMPLLTLRARDGQRLPHVKCGRCDSVWLIIDEAGDDYDDAVTKVATRMEPASPANKTPLTPRPVVGSEDVPIPMAEGKVFDDLPETHPAKQWLEQQRQEREHAEDAARAAAEAARHAERTR